jgi:hypothetical protein
LKAVATKWSSSDGRTIVEISPKVLDEIDRYCGKIRVRETGGILSGYYSDDDHNAFVTEASPPPKDSISGFCWFYRGVDGLKKLLQIKWDNPVLRTYYVGDWHYHPSLKVTPSDQDLKQMASISKAKNYRCTTPIMVIVGMKHKRTRKLRVLVFPKKEEFAELYLCSD